MAALTATSLNSRSAVAGSRVSLPRGACEWCIQRSRSTLDTCLYRWTPRSDLGSAQGSAAAADWRIAGSYGKSSQSCAAEQLAPAPAACSTSVQQCSVNSKYLTLLMVVMQAAQPPVGQHSLCAPARSPLTRA